MPHFFADAWPSGLFDNDDELFLVREWGYTELETPRVGAIAVYVGPEELGVTGRGVKHFGVVTGDDQVTSKWGFEGWLTTHPTGAVPAHYGTHIRYVYKPKGEGLVEEVEAAHLPIVLTDTGRRCHQMRLAMRALCPRLSGPSRSGPYTAPFYRAVKTKLVAWFKSDQPFDLAVLMEPIDPWIR